MTKKQSKHEITVVEKTKYNNKFNKKYSEHFENRNVKSIWINVCV